MYKKYVERLNNEREFRGLRLRGWSRERVRVS